MSFCHVTVLKEELVKFTCPKPINLGIDCTAGGGGHTDLLLKNLTEQGRVIAIDRDPKAIAFLRERFCKEIDQEKLILMNLKFSEIDSYLVSEGKAPDAIIADLGVSSPQIDQGSRGFSFMEDGPLDMRMNPGDGQSAKDLVNQLSELELRDIIFRYGEEPKARFIAREIVKKREEKLITTTRELANIICDAIHYKSKSKKNPATKTFQALRIFINSELEEAEKLISISMQRLAKKGRLGIITFHSLEDRIVKQAYKKVCSENIPKDIMLTAADLSKISKAEAKIIKPFPITPAETEVYQNPRSRSAKLRVLEKY
tara:strand:- start:49 stop:993 length:945 start_codon:yes stop_codon:yes gene_type:complete